MTKEEKISIQRQEIKKLMNYFENHQLDVNDTKVLETMQDALTKIFQVEIEELGYSYDPQRADNENTFDLQFINDSSLTWRGEHSSGGRLQKEQFIQGKPKISYNIANLYNGLESDDKDTRLLACKTVFKTVFHEIQHHRQYLMSRTNVSSKEGMLYARDFAVKKYLEKTWYSSDSKTGNYQQYAIENNANEVGYSQYLETIGIADREISDLRDIETGKFNISRYKANVNSWDGQSHYDSKGLQERDDVTVPILDDLISKRGRTEILKLYPILQKEYNMDGTKKSAIELIKNMQQEVQSISQDSSLSDRDKKILLKDGQEMYYELIYRELEKCTPEQIREIAEQIGKSESKELFGKISHYFQTELENRVGKASKMATAQEKAGDSGFVMPSNNGTIKVEQDGKAVQMTCEEFLKIIDPQLLEKKFMIPAGKEKGEMTASRFIEKFCFNNLAQNGLMTLKDGTQITAKQFVEEHMLQMGELRKDYTPRQFFIDTIQSESPWTVQKQDTDRLTKYYGDKKQFLSGLSDLATADKPMQAPKPTPIPVSPEQIASNMKWIETFLKSYDMTEDYMQYNYRAIYEDDNTIQVLNGIKKGEFEGTGLSQIDLDYFPNDREFNIQRAIPKIARLLKAADNITIDGGENYLEQFASIPNINEIINEMKNSKGVQEMFAQAQENIKTGNVPHHKKTRAEIDKKYAQTYLRSGNLTKDSIEEELEYRADSIRGAEMLAVDFDAKTKADIPMDRRQKVSLTRVIARQQGKVPSEVIQENGNFVMVIDTQKQKQQNLEVADNQYSYDNDDYISLTDITSSTLRAGTTKQDINSVVREIRTSQTREADKSYEK